MSGAIFDSKYFDSGEATRWVHWVTASSDAKYLESKIAAEISRVELFKIEFCRALYQW